jgi:prepilin-type N-terminal cleavage/methylation domain-containing protein
MKNTRKKPNGFTLTEVLIASAISLTVMGVTLAVYGDLMRSWRGVELRMDADREVNLALSHVVYGMDGRPGLRAASASSVTVTRPWAATRGRWPTVPADRRRKTTA